MKPQVFFYLHKGSMAMYKEPMPNVNNVKYLLNSERYKSDIELWQQSRIGYIKEPEWKYDDVVFDRKCNSYRIGKINKDETITAIGINKSIKRTFKEEDVSHYYSGQQKDRGSFRWMEEVNWEQVKIGDEVYYTEETDHVGYPSCKHTKGIIISEDTACAGIWIMDNGDEISMDWVTEWQPVDEPEEMIIGSLPPAGELGLKPNASYTKFQEDKKKGLIQLEEIKI